MSHDEMHRRKCGIIRYQLVDYFLIATRLSQYFDSLRELLSTPTYCGFTCALADRRGIGCLSVYELNIFAFQTKPHFAHMVNVASVCLRHSSS